MRFNRVPFEDLNSRIFAARCAALRQKANEILQQRLTNPNNLMYNFEAGGIVDVLTGKLFSGKFLIPADKFERIVKVHKGQELSSLVRLKNGQNYYAEITGHEPKYFKTALDAQEIEEQTKKMLDADQKIYDQMVDRYVSRMEAQ